MVEDHTHLFSGGKGLRGEKLENSALSFDEGDELRERSLRLTASLGDERLRSRLHPDFSPIGWHLGHVAWQEERWLHRRVAGKAPLRPDWEILFDSFASERSRRGELLPPKDALLAYVREVRRRSRSLLATGVGSGHLLLRDGWVLRFLVNHERQHLETMAALLLLVPAHEVPAPHRDLPPLALVAADEASDGAPEPSPSGASDWVHFPEGDFLMGTTTDPDAWDNESPAHLVHLPAFSLSRRPVTNAEWLQFMESGGYRDDRLWSPEGRAARERSGWEAPLHWIRGADGAWFRRTLVGFQPVVPSHPVAHISWYEAQAFARFAGHRLPREAEWERAASASAEVAGRSALDGPRGNLGLVVGDTSPCGSLPSGLGDLFGNVWEWCEDVFAPYPGFRPGPYREYSAPWFGSGYRILRGGSHLSDPAIARPTFRNWLDPKQRVYPTGLRLCSSRNEEGEGRPASVKASQKVLTDE